MTKEEQAKLDALKKQDEETEEETSDETEETTEEESEEDKSSSTEENESGIDYKALLLAEKERTEKAERALASDRYNASKRKREETKEEDDEESDDDKPLTKKDLQNLLQRERQATQKVLEETRALDIARQHTSSEDEAQASVLYWKTRVVPTGNIEEDILFAIGGLNNRKVKARNDELMRALKSKDGVSRDTATTHRDSMTSGAPKLSKGDEASMKRAGFAYDNKAKVWKKKLPNGKFLIKDPKSKKLIVQ